MRAPTPLVAKSDGPLAAFSCANSLPRSVHSGVRKNWLQRRFVLAGAVLSYFDDEGDKKGSIDLVAATSIRNSTCETAKGHEIEIETPDRTSTDQLCSRILCFFLAGQATACVAQVRIASGRPAKMRRTLGCVFSQRLWGGDNHDCVYPSTQPSIHSFILFHHHHTPRYSRICAKSSFVR